MAGEHTKVPYHLQAHGNHLTGYALKGLQYEIDQFGSPTTVAVAEDPNLDPFYLERALETSKHWDTRTIDDSDIELEDLENEYFMSYMTEKKQPSIPSQLYHPTQILADHYNSQPLRTPVCPATPDWQRNYNHCSQGSCSSIKTDDSGVTPDLTPSSSFSSTSSGTNCPDEVRKATQQLAFHSEKAGRNRTQGPRFFLPVATPDTWSGACTRPSTPTDRVAAANPGFGNSSSETLVMVHKESAAHAASSLRSKPLPSLPPILKNQGPTPVPKKSHNSGSKSHIDTSLISPPSLMNPVTMEPHTSPFDHALFIPAHDCPSPAPCPANPSPPITRQATNASTKGRPSTSTSVAYGEQSVWESDSDSESVSGRSQSRRGPIDTLRKVRSRVQLRRIAKSDAKLHAEFTSTLDAGLPTSPPPPELPHLPLYLDDRAAVSVTSVSDVLPKPLKQTLRLVAPSTTSLPRSPSRQSTEKGISEINTSTAAAIQAQSRRRQRSNATDESLPFSKAETIHQYYCHQQRSNTETSSIYRTSVFKRMWGSLRSLNCSNN
ncbi:hypothetical protein BGW36DRAFT_432348 [Talaromyces proteolyticus]|uniref:Uncharacterized protein n=1 Tax=Talaromyces proteolyticus TaxID=1131652 RepID=A0AAD4PVN3_9EURO|nr:uncharacterized protein BGW36DRAFT_432348 [Talaromyces proteolyticus]KAH8690550.1 hypothetical protein BGW36DRAFT_432348 [Talaromyces proteolyticus]